ncbi:hypothetical protein Q765_14230 [Flavobacterium rivuli WB 3.3-2 = DSM 21788]|uniref:Bacteriophage abortive infection AbiH n=1 Tax=Flavobacterium rivuli WB 3.3-2 = DSM 21788 TaxID=1121895 RepID=A0A0A2M2F5_9FLAO|nr:AbiH family protein [Flavobacterium rivuli]KGO85781.1 hypothetical protein Q765_14230 [Flavobacterium rivuli WB 3.3-2 = DSM 21788]
MNRIILIGNGFDLAHGMPTSYQSFMNYLWEKIVRKVQQERAESLFENDEIIVRVVPSAWLPGCNYQCLRQSVIKIRDLVFKNKFLQIITDKTTIHNWVDIENEYYYLLKKAYKESNSEIGISQLNEEFNKIKNYLGEYLVLIENNFNIEFDDINLKHRIGSAIYSNFKLKDFAEESINTKVAVEYAKIAKDIIGLNDDNIDMQDLDTEKQNLISYLGIDHKNKKLRKLLLSEASVEYFDLLPDDILFLNFNYTSTENLYKNANDFNVIRDVPSSSIHIHGSLREEDRNPIIFGFGDEIDEDYKAIENLNDNEFLDNIKSIKYLETDNYKKLLEYLNSGSYQIFLFGHSCGISDRTLLNTLFEHKNCVSIKPFYHVRNESDNYSDIVRNISRNFNNKVIMRDKVVNKEYCQPLF